MINLFISAIVFGTVILFGALGEIITEKSGNLNLGIPGIMYVGSISSVIGSFLYETACSNAGVRGLSGRRPANVHPPSAFCPASCRNILQP